MCNQPVSQERQQYGKIFCESFQAVFKRCVWAECLRNTAGIKVIDSVKSSKLACNVCLGNIKNLCELLELMENSAI